MADLDGSLRDRLSSLGIDAVRPLAGGASSLTFRGRLARRDVVVKISPHGVVPTAHRDVLRQAWVMKALSGNGIPVPAVLLEDRGQPPDVPPLFAMSALDGDAFEPLFDVRDETVPGNTVSARFLNACAVLGALHRIDLGTIGVGDEPVIAAADEVERWCRTLQTVDQDLVDGWVTVADLLRRSAPRTRRPVLVHGDYRLGNLLSDGQSITAVIDWEIWSVSDPRIDLGWFLINSDPRTYERGSRYADDVPSGAELVDHYCDAAGRDVDDVAWFQALACFKSTATWSLIVKHNRRRSAPDPSLEAMAARLPHLLEQAARYL